MSRCSLISLSYILYAVCEVNTRVLSVQIDLENNKKIACYSDSWIFIHYSDDSHLITNKRVICVFVLSYVCTVCERCSGSWSSRTIGRRVLSCPTSPLEGTWLLGPRAWTVLCWGVSAPQHCTPPGISVAAGSSSSRSWEDVNLIIIWAVWKSFPSHTVTEVDKPDGVLSHTVIPLNLYVYVCVCVCIYLYCIAQSGPHIYETLL